MRWYAFCLSPCASDGKVDAISVPSFCNLDILG